MVRRNVNVTTNEAFSIFFGWKDKKSALWITGAFEEGLGLGSKFSAIIVDVHRSSEELIVLADTPVGQKSRVTIELTGALFAGARNDADPSRESVAITASLPEGGMVFFVESFRRDIGHTP